MPHNSNSLASRKMRKENPPMLSSIVSIPASFLDMDDDEEDQRQQELMTGNWKRMGKASNAGIAKFRANFSRLNPFNQTVSLRKAFQETIARKNTKESTAPYQGFLEPVQSLNERRRFGRKSEDISRQQSMKPFQPIGEPGTFDAETFARKTLGVASWRLADTPTREDFEGVAKEESNGVEDKEGQSLTKGGFVSHQPSFSHSIQFQATIERESRTYTRSRSLSSPPPRPGKLSSKPNTSAPPPLPFTPSLPPKSRACNAAHNEQSVFTLENSPVSTRTAYQTSIEPQSPRSPFAKPFRGSSSSSATTAEWSEVSSITFEESNCNTDAALHDREGLRQYKSATLPSAIAQISGSAEERLLRQKGRSSKTKTSTRLSRSSTNIPPPPFPPPAFNLPCTPPAKKMAEGYRTSSSPFYVWE